MVTALANRWLVAAGAAVLAAAVLGGLWSWTRLAEQRTEDLLSTTASGASSAVGSWLEEHLAWQREAAYGLAGAELLSQPEREAALADAVATGHADFALLVAPDGTLLATHPPRVELPPGTDLRGRFPHIDAVLDGGTEATWATDQAVTDSGRVLAVVTRPTRDVPLLSVAFDPATTQLPVVAAAAVAAVDGLEVRVVEPTTGVDLLPPAGEPPPAPADGGVRRTAAVDDGLLETVVVGDPAGVVAVTGAGALLPRAGAAVLLAAILGLALALPRAARNQLDLQRDEARAAEVFDRGVTPMLLLDEHQRIVRVNPAMTALTGWSAQDLWQRDVETTLLHPDDVGPDLAEALRLPVPGGPSRGATVREVRLFDAAGHELRGRLAAVRVAEDSAGRAAVLLQFVDLTDLLAAGAAVERSRGELARFAGRVAHDLVNPLSAANGMATALLSMELPEDQRTLLLERVGSSTGAALGMVREMLASADRVGEEPWAEVELDELVADVEALASARLAATGGELEHRDLGRPLALPVSTTRRVLTNLVDNALKHALPGVPPRIVVEERRGARVHLVVVDNGTGVPAEELDRIFLGGHQLAPDAGGQGSGLAECRRLLAAVGGTIHAEQAPGGGLAVHVLLPRHAPDGAVPAAPAAGATSASAHTPAPLHSSG